jgi:hypothetical protein
LTPGEKVVWAVLANRIGENGFCWPGVRTIATDTGLTVTGILKCLQSLQRKKLLRIENQGNGKANHYRLTDGSAQQSLALNRVKRSTELNTGAQQSCAQALNRVELNKTDPFNKTQRVRPQGKFSPPSALEVQEYAHSIGFTLDGEKFVSHYAANGWTRGKSKMRDWRAAVRYWKATENTKNEYGRGKIRDHAEPVGEFVR